MTESHSRHRELQAVFEISDAIARAGALDEVYEAAIGAVRQALGVERASLLLFDEGGVMRFRAWSGLSASYRKATDGHSPWGRDAVDPQPIVITDVGRDGSLGPLQTTVLAEGIQALAFVPLVAAGRLIGKFMLYHERPHEFVEEELHLTATIANYVAVEIERRRAEQDLRLSRDQLQAVLRAVPEGITVQDRAGGLLFANETAARASGLDSVEQMLSDGAASIASQFEILDEFGEPFALGQLPGERVLAGEESAEAVIRARPRAGGEERWSHVQARAIRDESGDVRFAVNIFRDVTAERVARQRHQFLADATAALSSSLDLDETLQRLAAFLVSTLADWCLIHLVEEKEVRLVAITHVDTARLEHAREVTARYPARIDESQAVARVIRTGRAELATSITDETLTRVVVDEQDRQLLREELGSAMTVPIKGDSSTLGAITLVTAQSMRTLTDADLALVEEVAARTGSAIEKAFLHAEEREARAMSERASRRLAALESLSLVGLQSSPEDMLPGLLERARQALDADRATLLLLDPERDELRIHRAVGSHLATEEVVVPLGAGVAGTIAASGAPMIVSDLHKVPVVGRYLRERGGSLAGVPLHVHGQVAGVLHVSDDQVDRFQTDDLELLELLGERVSLVLERNSLWQQEHRMAETLQLSLLPKRLPSIADVSFAAHYQPASRGVEVGGDWYDAILCEDGTIGIAVGDVVGKGLAAAATMGQFRNALRAYVYEGHQPADALNRLNQFIESLGPPSLTTLFVGKVDAKTGALTYASAGHPPAALLHDGHISLLDDAQNLPLGVGFEYQASQQERVLHADDMLILFTDGLVERPDRPLGRGLASLTERLSVPVDSARALVQVGLSVLDEVEPADDIAILALHFAPGRLILELDNLEDLGPVRETLREWLGTLAVTGDRAVALTVACWEVLANAIEHPLRRTDNRVSLRAVAANGTVRVEIRDSGGWRPSIQRERRGLGLVLARGLVDGLEVRETDAGTNVILHHAMT